MKNIYVHCMSRVLVLVSTCEQALPKHVHGPL